MTGPQEYRLIADAMMDGLLDSIRPSRSLGRGGMPLSHTCYATSSPMLNKQVESTS